MGKNWKFSHFSLFFFHFFQIFPIFSHFEIPYWIKFPVVMANAVDFGHESESSFQSTRYNISRIEFLKSFRNLWKKLL